MNFKACLSVLALATLFLFPQSVCLAADLARVGDRVVTSEEFLEEFRIASYDRNPPERTEEGKKEFLDRLISKYLLSSFIHSKGWDTLTTWDDIIHVYEKGIYIQALYHDAIPELKDPASTSPTELVRLGQALIDSLVSVYEIEANEEAVSLIAAKSIVPIKEAEEEERKQHEGEDEPEVEDELVAEEIKEEGHGEDHVDEDRLLRFSWSDLFTDEEKAIPVGTYVGGALTIGEFAAEIDEMPEPARPIGGNHEEIALTVRHLAREEVIKTEFDKRNLREQKWFSSRIRNKKEGLILGSLFRHMQDTASVSEQEARDYYEQNKDLFRTVPLLKAATIAVADKEVAQRISDRVSQGEEFEAVAVDFSVYTQDGKGISTTEFFTKSDFPALFDAIWDRETGTVVGPVAQAESWLVAKLLERKEMRLLSFEEAESRVIPRVKMNKADEALAKLIEKLRAEASIEIDHEALDAVELPE